ncbi:hypothetical protein ACSMXN_22160 [Jatrophihabitans sp. DSM 45814]
MEEIRALLVLLNLDASDDLSEVDRIAETFLGVFPHVDAVVNAVTDAGRWQAELDAFARERGLTGFVALDRSALTAIAEQMVYAVPAHRAVYAFWR